MWKKLQKIMKQKGIKNVYQLSKITGINQATIGRWKYGETKPNVESLATLSQKLNVDVAEFFKK